jgi:hypothetical protein
MREQYMRSGEQYMTLSRQYMSSCSQYMRSGEQHDIKLAVVHELMWSVHALT